MEIVFGPEDEFALIFMAVPLSLMIGAGYFQSCLWIYNKIKHTENPIKKIIIKNQVVEVIEIKNNLL